MNIERNKYNWNKEPKIIDPKENKNITSPIAIDLFSGAGGISVGFDNADITPVISVDIHQPSIETYRENIPTAYSVLGDIRKIVDSFLYIQAQFLPRFCDMFFRYRFC